MLGKDIDKKGLIELLGLENMSVDAQTEIISSAVEVIEARVLVRILDRLNRRETGKFLKLIESGSEDGSKMEQFLSEKKLDLIAILKEETRQFKVDISSKLGID